MSQLAEAISYFRALDEWGERAREGIQAIVKKYAKPVGSAGSKTAPTVKATPKAAPKAASAAPTVNAQARPARPSVKVAAKPKAQLHAVTSLARRPVMGAGGAPCPKGSIRIGAHCHTDTGRTKKPRKPRKKVKIQKQGTGSPPPMGVTRKLVDPLAKKFGPSAKRPGAMPGSPGPSKLTRRPLGSIGGTGGAGKPKATFIPPTRQRAARKPVGAHPVTGAPHDRYSMLLARRKQQKSGVPGKVKT